MALLDARSLPQDARIEADLCVVGSGAAGLAIASRFLDRSRKVVLLESGGLGVEPEIQALARGRVVGQSHAPLDTCRLRAFGGTTNHWTAHVRRLEPIDFAQRDWVPRSGWPFGRDELEPYYEQARTFLHLPQRPFALEDEEGVAPTTSLGLDPERVETKLRYVVPEQDRRLGEQLRGRIERSTNVDTVLHASVLGIDLDESRRRVTGLRAGTLDGRRLTAHARHYVIAAGGIENARLLLLSSIEAGGLVGSHYANHPAAWVGVLQPSRPPFDPELYRGRLRSPGFILSSQRLTDAVQRELRVQNCWLEIIPAVRGKQALARVTDQSPDLSFAVADFDAADVARLAADVADRRAGLRHPPVVVGIRVIAEPRPNPASRVQLDDARDAFGQRRVALDWRLDPGDAESVRKSAQAFAREVGAAGLGRVRLLFPPTGFDSIETVYSHHHMGTTRMHVDPRQGVVDARCRMHGIGNLSLAGSSVFPTYGTANPTYTILALAFRLADHLREELDR